MIENLLYFAFGVLMGYLLTWRWINKRVKRARVLEKQFNYLENYSKGKLTQADLDRINAEASLYVRKDR